MNYYDFGEGNGSPLHYSCLENSMDRGAWWPKPMGSQRVRHDRVANTHIMTWARFIFTDHQHWT